MKYLILILLLITSCKTAPVQNITYNIQVPPQSIYGQLDSTQSGFDSLYFRNTYTSLPDILRNLPAPVQQVSGKGPVVMGDSNEVAGRKFKKVAKEKQKTVTNENNGLVWLGGLAIIILAGWLIFRTSKP